MHAMISTKLTSMPNSMKNDSSKEDDPPTSTAFDVDGFNEPRIYINIMGGEMRRATSSQKENRRKREKARESK